MPKLGGSKLMLAAEKPLHRKCTLGCSLLDQCLGGGIPSDSITEIVGESGLGKTQLCLQLCLFAQLPTSRGGLSGSSIYLYTEFPFPSRRLHQLSTGFGESNTPCDRIYVHSIHTADELLSTIPKIECFISKGNPVKVLVIDSIAALFRPEFENTAGDLKRRSSLFFKISGRLKALARRFEVAVVVTNQVVDVEEGEGLSVMVTMGRKVCPALGIGWANCVNSRLCLTRDAVTDKREMKVVFAPHLAQSSCEYVIKRDGVYGVQR